jgi:acetyltransferase-like isoleucine patch superfamily enzyme/glycosyltransferase involved in cell wall biosynthesis
MDKSSVSVIMPTYNEERSIGSLLLQLDGYDNVIADDSCDGTRDVATRLGARVVEGDGGESKSIGKALSDPLTKDYVVIMDADGSHDTAVVPRMLEDLSNGADIVVASRYAGGRTNQPFLSRLASKLGNVIADKALGLGVKDSTGRFMASKKEYLLVDGAWHGGGDAAIEILYRAKKGGLVIKEIPFEYRAAGKGRTQGNVLGLVKYVCRYSKRVISCKVGDWKLFSRRYIARGVASDSIESDKIEIGSWPIAAEYLQVPAYLVLSLPCRIPIIDQLCETIARCWSRGVVGFLLRAVYWKTKLGGMGVNVFIDQYSSIFGSRNVYIGSDTHIDTDVTIICAAGKLRVGDFVHIANGVVINGKPFVSIGDCTALAAGSKVYGSTTRPEGCMSPMVSRDKTIVDEVGVEIGRNCLVGLNTVVLPGARIGDNAVIGANSLVNSEISRMSIAFGNPARVVKERVLKVGAQ